MNDGAFDLMIADAFMPGMRGFEPIRAHIAVASGRRTFRKENKYWLSCRKKTMPRSLLSSTSTRRRKSPAHHVRPEHEAAPDDCE